MNKSVVVIGGLSSYIGQYLVEHLRFIHDVILTSSKEPKDIPAPSPQEARNSNRDLVWPKPVDVNDGEALRDLFLQTHPDVVIHVAAMSSIVECEKNPEKAMRVNCPHTILESLHNTCPKALLIFFSTDHVWDGKSVISYAPTYPTNPLNQYGKSKAAFEQAIRDKMHNHVILRSSVVYGPLPLHPRHSNKKGTLLQFILNNLPPLTAKGDSEDFEIVKMDDGTEDQKTKADVDESKKLTLFSDEVRNFVYIRDVLKVVENLIEATRQPERLDFLNSPKRRYNNKGGIGASKRYGQLLHLGGPEAITRLEFGQRVAKKLKLDGSKIQPMKRSDCKEAWAHTAPQPKDLSMETESLVAELNVPLTTLEEALTDMLERNELPPQVIHDNA